MGSFYQPRCTPEASQNIGSSLEIVASVSVQSIPISLRFLKFPVYLEPLLIGDIGHPSRDKHEPFLAPMAASRSPFVSGIGGIALLAIPLNNGESGNYWQAVHRLLAFGMYWG